MVDDLTLAKPLPVFWEQSLTGVPPRTVERKVQTLELGFCENHMRPELEKPHSTTPLKYSWGVCSSERMGSAPGHTASECQRDPGILAPPQTGCILLRRNQV